MLHWRAGVAWLSGPVGHSQGTRSPRCLAGFPGTFLLLRDGASTASRAQPPLLAAPSRRYLLLLWGPRGPLGQPRAVVQGREAGLPADAPGGSCRRTSVTSSVYRRANRCLRRESLNFDIQHKDVNTSPKQINPEY